MTVQLKKVVSILLSDQRIDIPLRIEKEKQQVILLKLTVKL